MTEERGILFEAGVEAQSPSLSLYYLPPPNAFTKHLSLQKISGK